MYDHGFILAFALTDFKLQGRTLPRLLISLGPRLQAPFYDINAFYVIFSRVRGFDGLRWLDCDLHELNRLFALRWKAELAGWEHGFDEAGVWCAQRACRWLEAHKEAIAASKEAAAQAKAATKPLEQLRHPELKERCAALGLDPVGTRAVLVARLQRAQGAAQAPPPAGRPAAPPKPKPPPEPAPKPAPKHAPIPPLPIPPLKPPAQPLKPPACQRLGRLLPSAVP